MPVQLLLPYIRPFGSKCFAGGLLHFRGSGFKAGDLPVPAALPTLATPSAEGTANPGHYSMFKRPERKEFPSRVGGILADSRPTNFDAKKGQIFQPETNISAKSAAWCGRSLMIYSGHSADLLPLRSCESTR